MLKSDSGGGRVLTDLYERLRRQVLGGLGDMGKIEGLGVLMNQGLGAWTLKCRELAPVVTDESRRSSVIDIIPFQLEREAVVMIAGMVLNQTVRELR